MKAATSWQDSVAKATVKDGSGGAIRLRLVPVTFFAEFIGKEMAAAVQKRTFAGMRDSGPDPQNPRQMELFKSKVKNWGVLMSNLGLVSGHFARDLRSGMSCQDLPSRAPTAAEHMDADSQGQQEQVENDEPENPTAPPARELDLDSPPSYEEKLVAEKVSFQLKKSRTGSEYYTFRYMPPWGPNKQMRMSVWYPSKALAARAIWAWAGDAYPERVHLSITALQITSFAPAVETAMAEAAITTQVRQLRADYVNHLAKFLDRHEVAAGQLQSMSVVEDDTLSRELLAAANASQEIWVETLDMALKCETDKWHGHVVEFGPTSICTITALKGLVIPTFTLQELEASGYLRKPFCLVHNKWSLGAFLAAKLWASLSEQALDFSRFDCRLQGAL